MANYNYRSSNHSNYRRPQQRSRSRRRRRNSGGLFMLLLTLVTLGAVLFAIFLALRPKQDPAVQQVLANQPATNPPVVMEQPTESENTYESTQAADVQNVVNTVDTVQAAPAPAPEASIAEAAQATNALAETTVAETTEAQSAADTPAVETAENLTVASAADYTVLNGVPQTDHPLGLAEGAQVDDSYFDDAVFIGDSVTLKLNYFVRNNRKQYPTLLGKAQFLTAGSMGSGNALEDVSSKSLHPTYQGTKMLLEDAVAAMGAKKVFIMLGMNDIAIYGPEGSAKNMMRLAKRIKDKSPDCKIFIESATPRIKGEYQKLNNNALFQYDLLLYDYCKQFASYGLYFVDIAYVMRDAEGNLPGNYCSDPEAQGIHFTDTACKIWVEYLYTHTLANQ